MLLFADATDLASFAKKNEVGVGTVSNWMDRWAKEGNEPIKPIGKFGNTQAYAIADLENLTVYKRNRGPKTVRIDQHNEVVERAQALAVENARLVKALFDLGYKLDSFEDGEPVLVKVDAIELELSSAGTNEV